MSFRPDVPEDLQQKAQSALRHYPDARDLEWMIRDFDRMQREFLDQHWLAPEDVGTPRVFNAGSES